MISGMASEFVGIHYTWRSSPKQLPQTLNPSLQQIQNRVQCFTGCPFDPIAARAMLIPEARIAAINSATFQGKFPEHLCQVPKPTMITIQRG